ncbi:MAG: hypothetical protein AAF762_01260 [Pseudomonadota bacterium]
MKTTLKATALIAALAAAGSATAMTVSDNGGQFDSLVSQVTDTAASPDTWASRIRGNQEGPYVEIVRLSELGAEGAALSGYLDTASVDLGDFHSAIDSQGRMSARLFANGFAAGDVVAYKAFGKDRIELYVDDIR